MRNFAVIPAAGRSQRMGEPKLLLPWGESTIIEQVLAAWRGSRVDVVLMVVHPDDARLAELGRKSGASVLQPDVPPAEMKVSVAIGLAHIARELRPEPTDAWLLAPADMPTLSAAVIDRLIDAHGTASSSGEATAPTIWVPAAAGRRGHPVLFPWSLAAEVQRLGPDEGINALAARYPVRTIEAEASAILEDLDTPADYQRLRGQQRCE